MLGMEVARLISLGDCEEATNLEKGWGENLGGARTGEMGKRLRRDESRSFTRAGGWRKAVSRAANAAPIEPNAGRQGWEIVLV